jgi:hypothetical protein
MPKPKVYELEIKVIPMETLDGKKKFNAYKVLGKDGRYMDLKFRKEVENLPKEKGLLYVASADLSIDNNRKFPATWIHKFEKFVPLSSQRSEDKKVAEFFGGNELVEDQQDDAEDTPF